MTIVQLASGALFNTAAPKAPQPVRHNAKGFIFYEGKSQLDGAPIVGIATLNTSNKKTGDMVQTWILRADISPTEAVKAGADKSVCGMCPHRHSLGGGCYVTPFQAPRAVYAAYKAGAYASGGDFSALLAGRSLRLGSYGDPAAIPFDIIKELTRHAKNHTGYTHQLHHKSFDERLTSLCMVSVDTVGDAKRAQRQGYKTFRVKTAHAPQLDGEVECLSTAAGIDCLTCGLCAAEQTSIVIDAHGTKAHRFDRFERIL